MKTGIYKHPVQLYSVLLFHVWSGNLLKEAVCSPLPPRCLFPFQAFVHKRHLTAIDHTWERTLAAGRKVVALTKK